MLQRRRRLAVEMLEDRLAPATFRPLEPGGLGAIAEVTQPPTTVRPGTMPVEQFQTNEQAGGNFGEVQTPDGTRSFSEIYVSNIGSTIEFRLAPFVSLSSTATITAKNTAGTLSNIGSRNYGSPLTLELVPGPGEKVGDPVTVRVAASFEGQLAAAIPALQFEKQYLVTAGVGDESKSVLSGVYTYTQTTDPNRQNTIEFNAKLGQTVRLGLRAIENLQFTPPLSTSFLFTPNLRTRVDILPGSLPPPTPVVAPIVNVLTHGWNPTGNPVGFNNLNDAGWQAFRANWDQLASNFNAMPGAGSTLAGQVQSYVSKWDSTAGFTIAAGALGLAKASEVLGIFYPPAARAASIFELTARMSSLISGNFARQAAQSIAADIQRLYPLNTSTPNLSPQIQLIGHSRGAAVNAEVSRILSAKGYTILQYTALDGFSTDWPDGGGVIGDIPIVGAAGQRLVNYRVDTGLVDYGIEAAGAFLRKYTGVSSPTLSSLMQRALTFAFGDFRAPSRSGFENICLFDYSTGTMRPTSHVTITNAYVQSASSSYPANRQYIYDNPVGWRRFEGQDPPQGNALQRGQFDATNCASDGVSDVLGPVGTGVIDGTFETLGQLFNLVGRSGLRSTGDNLLDTWFRVLGDRTQILSLLWRVNGIAELVPNNTSIRLTQTANTELGQTIQLPNGIGNIRFDLFVEQAGPSDRLEVRYDGRVIGTINLSDGSGTRTLNIPVGADVGELVFRLIGPTSDTSVIRLDNIRIDGQANWQPLATADRFTIPAGVARSFNAAEGVLANDVDLDGDGLTVTLVEGPQFGTLTLNPDGSFTYTPNPGTVGADRFLYRVTDGNGEGVIQEVKLTVETRAIIAGLDAGSGNRIQSLNLDGTPNWNLFPFEESFTGGARVATGDVNGDGVDDVIVGTGPGRATLVRIIDGANGQEIGSIEPFEASFTGGVYVAVADLDRDGFTDIIITPDQGGGPRVRIFSGKDRSVVLADFFGIDDPNFRGGARAATGDIDGDGFFDLLIGAGFGGGPRLAVFHGQLLFTEAPEKLFGDFFVFEESLRNGVFLTAGDLNADDQAEIVVGGGPGGGPRILALDGRELIASSGENRLAVANFFAGDTANRGGIRVVARDIDGDAHADLIVGSGEGAGTRATVYAGKDISPDGTPPELAAHDLFDGLSNGIFVA